MHKHKFTNSTSVKVADISYMIYKKAEAHKFKNVNRWILTVYFVYFLSWAQFTTVV